MRVKGICSTDRSRLFETGAGNLCYFGRRDQPYSSRRVGDITTKRIAVLGAPIDLGASQRGTLMGPAALRTAGLLTLLEGLGFDVADHGDLCISGIADLTDVPPKEANHYREIQRWTRALSSRGY